LKQSKYYNDPQKSEEFGQNKKMFWLMSLLSGILNRIPGSVLVKRVFYSIRRNGFRSFILDSVAYHLRRYALNFKMLIVCGMDMYYAMDRRWPDKSRFIPPKPVSPSCRLGKPSVCLITSNMSAGGAERQVAGLACSLKNLGYEVRVRVLCLDGECGHYLPYLKAHGVDISVPKIPGFSDIKLIKQQGVDISLIRHLPKEIRADAMAFAAEFARKPVDIVHCYLDWCCCYGGFAALMSGVPMIRFSWRNAIPTNFEFYIDWMPHIYRLLLQFPHIKVENNSFAGALDYTKWLELPQGKVEIMPNGVDPAWLCSLDEKHGVALRETIGIAPESLLVVSVGRLVAQKRPFDIPDILIALRKSLHSVSLVHAGDGPLKSEMQKYILSTGLDGISGNHGADTAMRLLGRRDDVFDILSCSDVFLLTSAHEGMPNALMEAMLAGLPVVATRVGGVPDLIQDGVHGYLHEVGDIAGMARSLERLLTDPALRKLMGNAGQERILSEFTVNNLTERVIRAYASQYSEIKQ